MERGRGEREKMERGREREKMERGRGEKEKVGTTNHCDRGHQFLPCRCIGCLSVSNLKS